ncbi:sigma-70 family RNA polymerase sigma factor [Cryptosporangium arvum]|uniref:sigma-70 family RNA polymerase sigma factor n=1 Tax=Cryptosporangium arvum TaxID=80871 RepID=UPI0004B6E969|nr:sigma-70 family RNA polymerase sigma factor [Cryptosporangium arvum]
MTVLEGATSRLLTDRDFAQRTDAYRPELLGYAYRMLGGLHDAEDAVQETLLRAWQARAQFAGRSSLRTWLYRIATNVCLRAVERSGRRPLPSGLGPSDLGEETTWLQPVPDVWVLPADADPAALAVARSSVRLAFVAALQHLPARQRAALLLRDVFAWPAADVAELLGVSVAAVTSALQRARAQLTRFPSIEDDLQDPTDPDLRALVEQYATAFENADVDALVRLLRHDVVWEMPPLRQWFVGREPVGRFLATTVFGVAGPWKIVATTANGRPALATYLAGPDGRPHAHALQVLEPTPTGIAAVVAFLDPALFEVFGLPASR